MGSQTTIPYFGRKWELIISSASGTSGGDSSIINLNSWSSTPNTPYATEPMHITFDIYTSATNCFWSADISIFNLSQETANTVITQGMTVQLSAGYQNQPYGLIWNGVIFQPQWSRQNVTDFKLNLHCIVGIDKSLKDNYVSHAFSGGLTQRQIVATMAAAAITPINLLPQDAQTQSNLEQNTVSRGGITHGDPLKHFVNASVVNGCNFWYEQQGAQLRQLLQAPDQVPTTKLGAGNGLIGTPVQTQFGVDLRVLLNPNITPGGQIQLDQRIAIEQASYAYGTYPSILDQSGVYAVGGVRHRGDSRGNEWYSEVTGMLYADKLLEVLGKWA